MERTSMIDAAFVRTWSARYPTEREPTRTLELEIERKLLEEVGPAVATRGYYVRSEFLRVGRWKSPRSITYLEHNTDDDIEYVTRSALAAPERLQHRFLDVLSGVGVKMASALLMIPAPERFTVCDFRAIETLGRPGELDTGFNPDDYLSYLRLCRALANRVGTNLRTLDRALWQWSKERGQATGC